MSANELARIYASSLIEIGQEMNILSDIEDELKFLADLTGENKELKQFFDSPGISRDAKKEFVENVFKGKLSDHIVNFLKVLIDNDRQSSIIDIYHALVELMDDVQNKQRVTIVSSVPLDSSLKSKLTAKLKEIYGKDIVLNEEVDGGIIGGIIVKIGDKVFDGSLEKDLRNIRNNLLNSKVRSEVTYED